MPRKIVFVGREPHIKTQSDVFFIDLLREIGDVTVIRRETLSNAECVRQIHAAKPDCVIFYQLPPSVWHHLLPLRGKRIIWVPMWDGFKKLSWKRRLFYRLFGVETVSFCQALHRYFESIALPSTAVQFFPKTTTSRVITPKPPYTLFLWQRDQSINLDLVTQLFAPGHIGKVIFKSDFSDSASDKYPFEVEKLTGWLPRDQLLQKITESDYYLAPRRQEGIGFSFLEAMAMGKIVIGYNDATMNEYIQDGVTGHLFGPASQITSLASPADLQSNTIEYGKQACNRWQQQREHLKALLAE